MDAVDKVFGAVFVLGGGTGGIAWSPPMQRMFEKQCIARNVECIGDVPGMLNMCEACVDAGNLAVQLPFGLSLLALLAFGIKFFSSFSGI